MEVITRSPNLNTSPHSSLSPHVSEKVTLSSEYRRHISPQTLKPRTLFNVGLTDRRLLSYCVILY